MELGRNAMNKTNGPSAGRKFINRGAKSQLGIKPKETKNEKHDNAPTPNASTKSGLPGTTETEKTTVSRNGTDAGSETQLVVSPVSEKSLEEVKFQSMNLIDSSVYQLSDLIKSIIPAEIDSAQIARNAHLASAVANCAKNITGLLRLKLDVIKEYKK